MDRETLIALRERVVNATGPDRGLDIHISHALGVDADWHGDLDNLGYNHLRGFCALGMRPLTASADAALALVERVLPGWGWQCGTCCVSDDALIFPDFNSPVHGDRLKAELGYDKMKAGDRYDTGFDTDRRPPGNVPLAILESLLSVLIAKETACG
jgi:hypothetical protein